MADQQSGEAAQPLSASIPAGHPDHEDSTDLLRSPMQLIVPVFLPVGIFEIGNGAAAPAVAVTALSMGATSSTAAAILALLGIGQIAADLPASTLASRIGDRRAMLVAAIASIAAAAAAFLARDLVVLACATTLFGACNAVFYLARQSFVTDTAHPSIVGTAMSTMGGAQRAGLFIGPLCGAAAISVGGLRSAFLVAVLSSVAVSVLLIASGSKSDAEYAATGPSAPVSWSFVLRRDRRVLSTLGVALAAVSALRTSKVIVIPLWAHSIGLSPAMTNIVVAVSAGLELVVFYPAGRVMDRWGRSWVVIPSMGILAASTVALPFTSGAASIMVVAALMGFGNGIGSGIQMTLAADVSTEPGRTKFLGLWRLVGDSGGAAGPAAASVIAGAASLAVAIMSLGGLGLLTTACLAFLLRRYAPRRRAGAHHDSRQGSASPAETTRLKASEA